MASHARPERVIASVRRLSRFPGEHDAGMGHESLTGRFRQRTIEDSAIHGNVNRAVPVASGVCELSSCVRHSASALMSSCWPPCAKADGTARSTDHDQDGHLSGFGSGSRLGSFAWEAFGEE